MGRRMTALVILLLASGLLNLAGKSLEGTVLIAAFWIVYAMPSTPTLPTSEGEK